MIGAGGFAADEIAKRDAEIERLRRQIKEERQAANILLREARTKVIEECAKVAENCAAFLENLIKKP